MHTVIGIQEDKLKAFELYKKSAENGFIPSQFELAKCYRYGEGTFKNNREILKWYISYYNNGGIIDVSNKIKKLQVKIFLYFNNFISHKSTLTDYI